jgi:hypothetical protein
MSRSFRNTKRFGITTAESEKLDKRQDHKMIRTRERESIAKVLTTDPDDVTFPSDLDGYNLWRRAKDGKMYWEDAKPKDMRK